MFQSLAALGFWSWLILAGLLLLAELAAPGVFFLWLGIAAACVGAVAFLVDLSWRMEVLLFAALSVGFVAVLRPRFRSKLTDTAEPNLNQRMFNYVGQTYSLASPISNGRGRLTIDDTVWEIEGPDMEAGQRVKVTGVDGTRLKVKPA
jgi:hypothetical protein